ncbi:MAG TPA: hypothetical protein VI603_11225 [Saprospiraceae bacterium]|nr:hypothetical protein [Saprospiraceae bacterium]
MSRISFIVLKHRILHALPIAATGFIVYVMANYLFYGQANGQAGSLSAWMLFLIWFAVDYAMISTTTEFWINPQFKDKLDEILPKGFLLKCEENGNKLYFKKLKFWRIHLVRILNEGNHVVLKVSDRDSESIESLITHDMLYGKKRRFPKFN